jgi:hypothetical protein
VARFLYSRSQYSPTARKPKPSAFNPEPYDELSTAHITGVPEDAIWQISRATLGVQPGRSQVYGRGDLQVADVIAQQLRAIRNDDPFERHTVIVDWPVLSDVAERKARWKEIALQLSQAATLHICPAPISADK